MDESLEHCRFHSNKIAEYTCVNCHRGFCKSCIILVEGEPFCDVCWEGFTARAKTSGAESSQSAQDIPWQKRQEIGFVTAFLDTIKMVVFEPGSFFSNLPSRTSLWAPLLFAVLCIVIFWFPMNVFYIKVFIPPLLSLMPVVDNPIFTEEIRLRFLSITEFDLLLMPLDFLISYIIISSFFQQMLVTLFHGRRGYTATLQIRCYAMAVQCLWLIPILGVLLAEIFSLVLCTRGFQVAQKLSLPHAFLVAAVPILIYFAAISFSL